MSKRNIRHEVIPIDGEVWKPSIEGFEISNYGRLKQLKSFKSSPRHKSGVWVDKPYIRQPSVNNSGYKIITIKGKIYLIHRLVASAFIPNPDNFSDVDHINGDKFNNCADNLRWMSHGDNMRAYRKPQKHKEFVKKIVKRKINEIYVVETGECLGSIKEASKKLNISLARISQITSSKSAIFRGNYKGLHIVKKQRVEKIHFLIRNPN